MTTSQLRHSLLETMAGYNQTQENVLELESNLYTVTFDLDLFENKIGEIENDLSELERKTTYHTHTETKDNSQLLEYLANTVSQARRSISSLVESYAVVSSGLKNITDNVNDLDKTTASINHVQFVYDDISEKVNKNSNYIK